jgi:hypothetical protein
MSCSAAHFGFSRRNLPLDPVHRGYTGPAQPLPPGVVVSRACRCRYRSPPAASSSSRKPTRRRNDRSKVVTRPSGSQPLATDRSLASCRGPWPHRPRYREIRAAKKETRANGWFDHRSGCVDHAFLGCSCRTNDHIRTCRRNAGETPEKRSSRCAIYML